MFKLVIPYNLLYYFQIIEEPLGRELLQCLFTYSYIVCKHKMFMNGEVCAYTF